MKNERMKLTLAPSKAMDKWAEKNEEEHKRVRMSKRARLYYGPSDWTSIYIRVHGVAAEAKLRLGQAANEDIKKIGAPQAKRVGFVTTKTYEELMGTRENTANREIWVSESAAKITLGADPEFALVQENGTAVYGDNVFTVNKWGQLGSDGPCAELRPNPSDTIEGIVANIETLLRNNSAAIRNYKWIGGATYRNKEMTRRYSIGGHIHFGLPNIPGAGQAPNHILQRRIVRILDEMVALPLVRIDTPLPEERRGPLRYGRFEDIKTYDVKFEWRVPSGIWLVHKEIAAAVLGTSKAVVEECWKKYEDHDNSATFMLNTDTKDSLVNAFNCINTEKVRDIINSANRAAVGTELVHGIHAKLKKMSTYCRYKEEIDNFVSMCCSNSMPLPEAKLELRRSWIDNLPL